MKTEAKKNVTKYTCDSNRDVKNLFWKIANGKTNLADGWHCINNGIYFRFHYEERKDQDLFQIALKIDKFDNEYLLDHSKKLLEGFLESIMGYQIKGDWDRESGETLDIYGAGEATIFHARSVEI